MGDLHVSLFPLVTIPSPRFELLLPGAFQNWTISDLVYGFDENFRHFFSSCDRFIRSTGLSSRRTQLRRWAIIDETKLLNWQRSKWKEAPIKQRKIPDTLWNHKFRKGEGVTMPPIWDTLKTREVDGAECRNNYLTYKLFN